MGIETINNPVFATKHKATAYADRYGDTPLGPAYSDGTHLELMACDFTPEGYGYMRSPEGDHAWVHRTDLIHVSGNLGPAVGATPIQ